ncbi:MAG: mannonate dehydratase [Tenuifilaceae bacterium]|nr:mannonate dehydratase [Tenuifilaceae bacterium]
MTRMIETWRWYGPNDPVSLRDIRQAGATGIVHALHELPIGEVWHLDQLIERKRTIEWDDSTHPSKPTGLKWEVVESIPVHDSIKLAKPDRDIYIDNYIQSMRNVAAIGIKTVVYNFMPVVDWTRTNLDLELEDGAKALAFDISEFIAFDLFILSREGATEEYTDKEIDRAVLCYSKMTEEDKQKLQNNIIAGLPGAQEGYSLEEFKLRLKEYKNIDNKIYRENLAYFLRKVVPVAEELGIRLAIHPDDPPRPLFGLPRIVSTTEDFQYILDITNSLSNGFTLCTGSLGAREDNNLVQFVKKFGPHIHFAHLRSVKRYAEGCFLEDAHLKGDVDMYGVVAAILDEQLRRMANDREDYRVPMRADHGHVILDDLNKKTNPGYSAIGLLKGMAELRGLELGIIKSRMLKEM